jgi:peptidylprolyl isomerase
MKKIYLKSILKLSILIFFPLLLNASEIEILSEIPGTGPKIINHSKVSVHYRGTLEDGTEFDSSFKRNQPFVFQIGIRQVILGWEIGLMDMKVGGKRKIKIPSELAYGETGAGDRIPPNATLIFDVEIIAIQPPGYRIINGDELLSMQQKELIVIDIRTEEEWEETGIIKNSKKITAFDQEGNFNPAFLNSFESLTKKNKENSKVVFVSKEGDISSILANGFVEQLGYKKMLSLQGGIKEWINLGLPLKK